MTTAFPNHLAPSEMAPFNMLEVAWNARIPHPFKTSSSYPRGQLNKWTVMTPDAGKVLYDSCGMGLIVRVSAGDVIAFVQLASRCGQGIDLPPGSSV